MGTADDRDSPDPRHQEHGQWAAISVNSNRVRFRTEPCGPETNGPGALPCPWRVDATPGTFPADAFRHSAPTAYDVSERRFGCHNSTDPQRPQTCAGFLLRGAQHNVHVRAYGPDESLINDGGHELYPSYRAMAVANGVSENDPALVPCRNYQFPPRDEDVVS